MMIKPSGNRSVVGGARTAAQNSDHEIRIVLREFLHKARAVVNDLQENRPTGFGDAREGADNIVVDELTELFGWNAAVHVRIEDFEEIAETFALGFFTKFLECLQCDFVPREVICERN